MLKALYERGITPDFLVGTSIGALNAAFVASRLQSPQTATELGRVRCDLQRQDVFPLSLSALVGAVCGRRDHLVSDRELRRLIRAIDRSAPANPRTSAPGRSTSLHRAAATLAASRHLVRTRVVPRSL